MSSEKTPRVVVADDSAFMRRLISDVLGRAGMEVVAEAANGREAIEACRLHSPDILSLDLAMPELDGIEVLKQLRPQTQSRNGTGPQLRIVVVSSFSERDGVRAVDALSEGAFELVPKRAAGGKLQDFLDDLLSKLEAAVVESRTMPKRTIAPAPAVKSEQPAERRRVPRSIADAKGARRLVLIASSTGGPRALTTVARQFPADLGQGLLIVQHMPAGFTQSLASRLDTYARLSIAEAVGGEKITASSGLIAPGGHHMRIRRKRIELSDEPPVGGLRPCADITIEDAVNEFGGNIVLAVLTGMGRDALAGARKVHEAGGVVIAEHADTTTVNGMPKAVVDAGIADGILPIEEIGVAITECAGG